MSKTYTEEQVREATLEYFHGDQLATNVFVTKYALKDGEGNFVELTPEDMHRRMAREFARIEDQYENPMSEEEIFGLFDNFDYVVPQGSPMYGIGNPYKNVSLSNCVVVGSPKDTMSSIVNKGRDLANLFKRRAGVGLDISTLRPAGQPVSNSAETTSGAYSFADMYSYICRMVGQNGRRGALMITLDVQHPDVKKFIQMKADKTKVTGANVSLKITDEFMKAVECGGEYELRWPLDAEEPEVSMWVDAQEIWDLIIQHATDHAEPGLIMWDNVEKYLPAQEYWDHVSTNPCQPAWATVLTPDGISTMGEIEIGDTIWSGEQWTEVVDKACTGIKPVYAYRTNAGTFYGTDEHRVLQRGERVEAQDAEAIDLAVGPHIEVDICHQSVVDGLVVGDGMSHKASNGKIVLCVGDKDASYFDSEASDYIGMASSITEYGFDVETTIEDLPRTFDRCVPDRYKHGTPDKAASFLRGLYSANGSLVSGGGSRRVTLKTTSKDIVEDVQSMLSSLGIKSYFTTNKEADTEFENGTYTCKESYDVNIGYAEGRRRFRDLIGFIQPYKQEALERLCEVNGYGSKESYEVVEKELIGQEPVFDITVEADEHTYWTNGLLVSNCAEIPLSPNDSCRLISVNLKNFVKDAFEDDAEFDFDHFTEVVGKAMRLNDDLVDLELEALEGIREEACDTEDEMALWQELWQAAYDGRRTGLGTHGLADCLAGLGLRYGDQSSLDMVDRIYEAFRNAAYRESVELAKERGPFPIFEWENEKDNLYISRLPQSLQEDIARFGRRNISLLTCAPTGSVSIESQTSSGVEPVFRNVYTRRRKVGEDEDARIDYVDEMGDRWQEYTVYHHNVRDWLDQADRIVGSADDLPDFFVTSDEIDWEARVDVQATQQYYIDHSISSTINLPRGTDPEVVGTLYKKAWKAGLKGVTVYVEGSRDGVLLSKYGNLLQVLAEYDGFEYPEINEDQVIVDGVHLPDKFSNSDMELFNSPEGGKYYMMLSYLPKDKDHQFPIAFWIHANRMGDKEWVVLNRAVKSVGKLLVKAGVKPELCRQQIEKLKERDEPHHARLGKIVSMAMRHNIKLPRIIKSLEGIEGDYISHTLTAMRRFLKNAVQDGTVADKECDSCGDESVVFEEGCYVCKSCGNSGCS